MSSPLLEELITSLRCLPGIGQKSAQRMALHLLQHDRMRAKQLSLVLGDALDRIQHCAQCRTFTEENICTLCANDARDQQILCVVESPADVMAIEQTLGFRGYYFVLLGRLSPLDGIGPEALGMPLLWERLDCGFIKELIVATNLTVEGEATAHYIAQVAGKKGIQVTRIAHGVPSGGELEYLDANTLSRAMLARTPLTVIAQDH